MILGVASLESRASQYPRSLSHPLGVMVERGKLTATPSPLCKMGNLSPARTRAVCLSLTHFLWCFCVHRVFLRFNLCHVSQGCTRRPWRRC